MSKKYIILALVIMAVATAMIMFCIESINELDYSIIDKRSRVIYDANGNVVSYTLSEDNDSYRFYTKIEDVSPLYISMLLASEDKRFYSHYGVDFLSVGRAFFKNLVRSKITSGGSTIAMQVVKRLTGHERTYINKLKEIVQAIYITKKYGRDQVLEWYLTIAPFGSNVEGVKAASLKWFNHLPKKMSPSEAALLTALPRAPEHIRPDKNHKATIYYKNEVLRLAYENGVLGYDAWQASIMDDLPDVMFQIPQNSRTLGSVLFANRTEREIYTELDPNIQLNLLNEANNFNEQHNDGAVLSVVVLNSINHKIVGILGSSDLKKSEICLPYSKRSPGSALKPFAYGLAFQYGKLHPKTLLHDNSRLYGIWNPANFSRTYSGKVTAENALTSSLNLPALEVLRIVGPTRFYDTLNLVQKRLYVNDDKVDYSIVLGSGAISLIDLAQLYAMINEDGLLHYFSIEKDEYTNNVKNINDVKQSKISIQSKYPIIMLDKYSARAVFNILKKTKRPFNGLSLDDVSYKTGTSSRFTDALAIGNYKNYTIAVAIRFPDNKVGSYLYTGYKDAAPVLFSIANSLHTVEFIKEPLTHELLSDTLPEAFVENLDSDDVIDKEALHIDFPKNGDTIMPDYNGNVFIRYSGGKGKVYLQAGDEQTENKYFTPQSEGVYRVSVLDEYGHSDSVEFNVIK